MSAFTATLGLPTKQLPTAYVPRLKDRAALPPMGPLRDAYLVYVCAQLAESAAGRLVGSTPAFQHTGLHKRTTRLHAGADSVVETLFGHFNTSAADTLNHLTRTAETALAALVLLAVSPDTTDTTLERVSELLAELAGLAGLNPE
jgi:hypothetical protein